MGYTGLGFNLPRVGTTGNWGNAINGNFRLIESEVYKIYNRIGTLQALLGADTPYIKVDENRYFVIIKASKNNEQIVWTFEYYPKSVTIRANGSMNEDDEHYTYKYSDGEWTQKIPNFLAAYVYDVYYEDGLDDTSMEASSLFGGQIFTTGDLMVRAQSFGSVYGDNSVVTFKKYPPLDDQLYYPNLDKTAPYKLVFEKANYIDWYFKNKTINLTLPSIGMGTFTEFAFATGEAGITYINGTETDQNISKSADSSTGTVVFTIAKTEEQYLQPQIKWFLEDSKGARRQILISYDYSVADVGDTIQITINVDLNGLILGEKLVGQMYITFNDSTIDYNIAE